MSAPTATNAASSLVTPPLRVGIAEILAGADGDASRAAIAVCVFANDATGNAIRTHGFFDNDPMLMKFYGVDGVITNSWNTVENPKLRENIEACIVSTGLDHPDLAMELCLYLAAEFGAIFGPPADPSQRHGNRDRIWYAADPELDARIRALGDDDIELARAIMARRVMR